MDIHHLKIFYMACNEKSFTKASKKMYISQSAVSIQIKKLENSLSTQLIERNSKKFKLTYAGKELYRMSQDIFGKISRMENEMKRLISTKQSKIVVGATHNIGEPVLPRIIIDYTEKYPDTEFDIFIKNKESLISRLKEGTIDVILMGEKMIDNDDYEVIDTDDYPYVMIAPNKVNKYEDLKDIYLLKRDSVLANKYISQFEKTTDLNFIKKMTVNGSIETIKNLVMSGLGYSVIPYYCVFDEVKRKKLKIIHKFEKSEDKFQIVFLKENNEKKSLMKFINFMKNYAINNPLISMYDEEILKK